MNKGGGRGKNLISPLSLSVLQGKKGKRYKKLVQLTILQGGCFCLFSFLAPPVPGPICYLYAFFSKIFWHASCHWAVGRGNVTKWQKKSRWPKKSDRGLPLLPWLLHPMQWKDLHSALQEKPWYSAKKFIKISVPFPFPW